MPINLRDKLNFLFNGGRGIGTDQLDGAFVKSATSAGQFTVQLTDGTESTVSIDNVSDARRLSLIEQLANELELREHSGWQNTTVATAAAFVVLPTSTTVTLGALPGYSWGLTHTVNGDATYLVFLRLSEGRDINSVQVARVSSGGAVRPALHGSFIPYHSGGGYDYYQLAYGDSPAEATDRISLVDDDVMTMQTSVFNSQTEYKGYIDGKITGSEQRAIVDATSRTSDISISTAETWSVSAAGIQYAVIPRSGAEFDRIAADQAPSNSVTWRIGHTFTAAEAGPKHVVIRVPVAAYAGIRNYRILFGTHADNLGVLNEYHSDTSYHYLDVEINLPVGTQVVIQTHGTGVHTQFDGLLSSAQVLAALKTALASATDADKFELMHNLAASEQLFRDDSLAARNTSSWAVITLSRSLVAATDGNKILEVMFETTHLRAVIFRVMVSEFLALTPQATTGQTVVNAIPMRTVRGEIDNFNNDQNAGTILIARPTQTIQDTNQLMLGSTNFRSGGQRWSNFRRTILLRSF